MNNAKNEVYNSKESAALGKIFDTVVARTSTLGFAFGESFNGTDRNAQKDLVSTLVQATFNHDLNKARGEAGIATNGSVNAIYRQNLIKSLQEEMKQRGEQLFTPQGEQFFASVSQMWPIYGSHSVNSQQQLALMALCPAVIKPIYNKIVNTIVTKDIEFIRAGFMPVIFDEAGNKYNFFEIVNDIDMIKKISSGGQPLIELEIPIKDGVIDQLDKNGNLCDIYNREGQAKDPINFKTITSIHDFIATGIKLTYIVYDGKKYEVGEQTVKPYVKSGQLNNMVAAIHTRLTNPEDPKVILDFNGRIDGNGNIILNVSGDDKKVTGVAFSFVVPAKGAESPLKIMDMETKFSTPILKKATMSTTLNAQLIDDINLKLNKDLVARFTETSVESVNHQKDSALLNYIKDHLNDMANNASNIEQFRNDESLQSLKAIYAYQLADMTVARPGYTDILTGHNTILALSMFNVMNKIDKELNPAEKNFSVFSDSAASQWLRDAMGRDTTMFNIVGSATDSAGDIAGISTPYELQNIKVGNLYTGTYIVTNKLKGEQVEKDVIDAGAKAKKVISNQHRYYILPKFEEKMDTIIFLNGLERVTEGVNDSEFLKDKTLNYDTRYDIAVYNKSIGAVDFIESPVSSYK